MLLSTYHLRDWQHLEPDVVGRLVIAALEDAQEQVVNEFSLAGPVPVLNRRTGVGENLTYYLDPVLDINIRPRPPGLYGLFYVLNADASIMGC